MVLFTTVAIYVLGMISGAMVMIIATVSVGKQIIDKRKNEVEKVESVNARMKKVKELTSEQLNLQSYAQEPQKNALHGRHKNGLIERIKELETTKNEILKSIITDGFDPKITILDKAGVVSTIKLSEYLAQISITIPPKNPPSPIKQIGKLTVYEGGKDDGKTVH